MGAVGSFYIGYTARQLEEECLRWLTKRGASKQAEDGTFVDPSKRNRPVLLMHDGSTITMGKARKELGFDRVEVYASTLKINARAVEDALQYRYQHLPLGIRLWRYPDKGSKFDKVVDGKLHKVFITYLLACHRAEARCAQDQDRQMKQLLAKGRRWRAEEHYELPSAPSTRSFLGLGTKVRVGSGIGTW